jgi:hypothetical protein
MYIRYTNKTSNKMGFTKQMSKGFNVKSMSKGIKTSMNNISSGIGGSISNIGNAGVGVFSGGIQSIMPIVDSAESVITSPLMIVGVVVVGAVLFSMVGGATKVGSDAMNNPESIKAIAAAMR